MPITVVLYPAKYLCLEMLFSDEITGYKQPLSPPEVITCDTVYGYMYV